MLDLLQSGAFLADFDRGPFEQGELMGIAFMPLLCAVIIFWIGLKLQISGKPHWIKWIALLPLIVGLFLGLEPTQKYFGDSLYRELYGGTWKKGMMHAGGIWVSILGAVGLFLWNKWATRQKFEEL